MHEISLAHRIREELSKKDFSSVELEVGVVSIHDTPHSKGTLKKMLADFFPGKKIKVRFLQPELKCECGHSEKISGSIECGKCGKKMRLETNEGYKIKKLEK